VKATHEEEQSSNLVDDGNDNHQQGRAPRDSVVAGWFRLADEPGRRSWPKLYCDTGSPSSATPCSCRPSSRRSDRHCAMLAASWGRNPGAGLETRVSYEFCWQTSAGTCKPTFFIL
jgi:hypothetical protein